MSATRTRPGETVAGAAILAVLLSIAIGMFVKQSRFDPAFYSAMTTKAGPESLAGGANSSASPTASGGRVSLMDPVPEGVDVLSPVETFDSETLSEKIDGKAELYLASGFVSLVCQRFVPRGNPDSWFEAYVYEMRDPRNAFSVWSAQRRSDAVKSDLTPFAYSTANALFFVAGSKYAEIVGAKEGLSAEMQVLARSLAGQAGGGNAQNVGELALFPPEGLDPGSIALHATDVFGFDGLNDTFTATYSAGGATLTAFLSRRATPEEALKLASAYHDFLLQNGGKDVTWGVEMPEGARLVEIFGSFEAIFCSGRILAGVHEGETKEPAENLAAALQRALKEAGK